MGSLLVFNYFGCFLCLDKDMALLHLAKQVPGTDQEKTAPFPLIEGKSENRQRDEALESQLP